MMIDLATLRKRAAEMLGSYQLWRRSASRSAQEPTLPSFTPHLFKLAQIAVGDADSAAMLTADVLAKHVDQPDLPEDALLYTLVKRVPQGWLGWPSETGPGEWLPLGIRREQADRLLSLLGEWQAHERVALALYLLRDVRRDDLDHLLGIDGIGERLGGRINGVGQSLGLIKLTDMGAACMSTAEDLVDADDPQIGRQVRHHTMGCEGCRQRVAGLRRTTQVLRVALGVFFRAKPPAHLARLVVEQRRQQRKLPIKPWHYAVAALVVLLLINNALNDTPASTAASAPPRPTAAEMLSRALDRFAADAPRAGVLHERIHFANNAEMLILERWYDYGSPQRLRVTVRRQGTTVPILDLSTDGISRIAYDLDQTYRAPSSALIHDPDTATLMPLLRQLPFTGSFGDSRIDQRYLDLTLLAQAQRNGVTLLGTTGWQGRPAALLSSTTSDGSRMILTLDQATASLLEARIMPEMDGATTARTVWQADLFEVVTRAQLPRGVFELSARKHVLPKINPRQFMLSPLANLDINTALATSALPVPQHFPQPPLLAYIRNIERGNAATMQMYESVWSSVAILTPRRSEPLSSRTLDRSFAHGRYALIDHALPNTTIVEFSMSGVDDRRLRLYLWHGLADESERQTLALTILDSLVMIDSSSSIATLDFVAPPGRSRPAGWRLPPATSPQQSYLRAKSRQLLQLETSALDVPVFLRR